MSKHKWILGVLLLAACATPGGNQASHRGESRPTPEEAKAFVARVNRDLKELWTREATAAWVKATYITEDTDRLAAWAREEVMAYLSRAVEESKRFDGLELDEETARALWLLRLSLPVPAPSEPEKRSELAMVESQMERSEERRVGQQWRARTRWCHEHRTHA